jgi:hypothetical protein
LDPDGKKTVKVIAQVDDPVIEKQSNGGQAGNPWDEVLVREHQ